MRVLPEPLQHLLPLLLQTLLGYRFASAQRLGKERDSQLLQNRLDPGGDHVVVPADRAMDHDDARLPDFVLAEQILTLKGGLTLAALYVQKVSLWIGSAATTSMRAKT